MNRGFEQRGRALENEYFRRVSGCCSLPLGRAAGQPTGGPLSVPGVHACDLTSPSTPPVTHLVPVQEDERKIAALAEKAAAAI
jgi:hypothetical protein